MMLRRKGNCVRKIFCLAGLALLVAMEDLAFLIETFALRDEGFAYFSRRSLEQACPLLGEGKKVGHRQLQRAAPAEHVADIPRKTMQAQARYLVEFARHVGGFDAADVKALCLDPKGVARSHEASLVDHSARLAWCWKRQVRVRPWVRAGALDAARC